jgi:hypothetical protein
VDAGDGPDADPPEFGAGLSVVSVGPLLAKIGAIAAAAAVSRLLAGRAEGPPVEGRGIPGDRRPGVRRHSV